MFIVYLLAGCWLITNPYLGGLFSYSRTTLHGCSTNTQRGFLLAIRLKNINAKGSKMLLIVLKSYVRCHLLMLYPSVRVYPVAHLDLVSCK
jgi:hypothetical protein